ncbi:hypothetical protein C7B61_06010 [filamentous cyanobacterium CCP1]|jgi:predicted membrane channel-forming protein YqfA (hemolysin III family)|nr:hypothetical protein C7B76_17730 [filamentous cyanobacterium CCP2]PSB67465.1 hypothetical protein C7B61_06010 [filamentous cyanobacterium CCP1]
MFSQLGNWFFLFGSLLFTVDALLNFLAVHSVRAFILLVGSLLFTVGCIFFILDMPKKIKSQR